MNKWYGSAAVCVNDQGELLMVKQGTPAEIKKWAVPSGGREENESFEACCLRELKEETGYEGKILRKIKVKKSRIGDLAVEVHYFEVEITGGRAELNDPDELIYEIRWQSAEEIKSLLLSFPEDREFLLRVIKNSIKA